MDLPCNKFGTGRHDLQSKFLLPGIFVYFQRFEDVRKDLVIDFSAFPICGFIAIIVVDGPVITTFAIAGVPTVVLEADAHTRTCTDG